MPRPRAPSTPKTRSLKVKHQWNLQRQDHFKYENTIHYLQDPFAKEESLLKLE